MGLVNNERWLMYYAVLCASLRIGIKQPLCILHAARDAGDAACCLHGINPLLLFWPDATCG